MDFRKTSDSSGDFFTAVSDCEVGLTDAELTSVLDEMLSLICQADIGRGVYDSQALLMLEVCCDTGRLIMATGSGVGSSRRTRVGCSVRLQRLQDFWYDLDESGVSGECFSAELRQRVQHIGAVFHTLATERTQFICASIRQSTFRALLFDSNPKGAVIERTYQLA